MDQENKQLDDAMNERFKKLPKVVQDAITSAEVEKHLRELANAHKLHLDQWTALENEVMLALLGFEPATNLAANIKSEVGVDEAAAAALAADISKIVFEPIRGELERRLEHPEAEAEKQSGVDTVRDQMLSTASAQASTAPMPTPVPEAPPQEPKPVQKVERAPLTSAAYAPRVPSHERKDIEGDPYREPIA